MEIKFENELVIKSRKSAVVFEADLTKDGVFNFTVSEFEKLTEYIQLMAEKSWSNITPKEAQSEASDYWEYYDKELDNNGYLRFGCNQLVITRPDRTHKRLYQFNKRKMESFLYDLQKKL